MTDINTTILIPTYNRSKELFRLLTFLKILNNPYPVVVLDGSSIKNQNRNRAIVKKFENITCPAFPEGMHIGLRYYKGLNEFVTTEYVVFCGDDDFIIPKAIEKCAGFLDDNSEYSAVNGTVKCLAYPKKYSRSGFFAFIDDLKYPLILDQPTFLARFLKMNAVYEQGCPPLFYAVRRTNQAREIFRRNHENFKYTSQEALSDALTLIWGKSTTLPYLLNIRDYSSETIREEIRGDPVYIFSQEDAKYIRDVLTEELRKSRENLSAEIIQYTLDQFIKIPLSPTVRKLKPQDLKTPLSIYFSYKRNWIFYLINFIFPKFNELFDLSLKEEIIIALRKAFRAPLKTDFQ